MWSERCGSRRLGQNVSNTNKGNGRSSTTRGRGLQCCHDCKRGMKTKQYFSPVRQRTIGHVRARFTVDMVHEIGSTALHVLFCPFSLCEPRCVSGGRLGPLDGRTGHTESAGLSGCLSLCKFAELGSEVQFITAKAPPVSSGAGGG